MAADEFDTLLKGVAETPDATATFVGVGGVGGVAAISDFSGTRRYEVVRFLGEGGFGVVYEVADRATGDRLALKVLKSATPEWLYRFKKEFRALADLRHRNLVRLHELVEEDGLWFFAMELVEGKSFRRYVRAGEPQLRHALGGLASGLAAVHRHGHVHRDIKPSNVKVTPDDRVVLLDFGLIKPLGETHSRQIVGTPTYMSPEQCSERRLTGASDWYGVGVMLFEALCGKPPFDGGFIDVAARKTKLTAPLVTDWCPDAPADLAAIAAHLLALDPNKRAPGRDALLEFGSETTPELESRQPSAHANLLIGRDDLVATLHGALADTRSGRPAVVHVRGESGTGKSALIENFFAAAECEGEGAMVLRGRCLERETVPNKALDAAIDELCLALSSLSRREAASVVPRDAIALARVFPTLSRVEAISGAGGREVDEVDPHEVRRRATGALAELLARLADQNPVVLSIDDLQWGDAESIALLADLLCRADPPAVLLVLCYRTADVTGSQALQALEAEEALNTDAVFIDVGALEPEHARTLAMTCFDRDPGVVVDSIVQESAGHPLLLLSLARFAASRSVTEPETVAGVPLERVVAARIEALTDDARKLLEVLAVAAGPVELDIALIAAGITGGPTDSEEELCSAGLGRVRVGPTATVETFHDRIRLAVMVAIAPAHRAAIHRALAEALESRDNVDPERLLQHWDGAGDYPAACAYAVRAAEAAIAGSAFSHGAELLAYALEHRAADDESVAELLAMRAQALADAGRGEEAAQAYLAAADLQPSPRSITLKRHAADQYLFVGRFDRGRELFFEVLSELGIRMPRTARGALLGYVYKTVKLGARDPESISRRPEPVTDWEIERFESCIKACRSLFYFDVAPALFLSAVAYEVALASGDPHQVAIALPAWEMTRSAKPSAEPRLRRSFAAAVRLASVEGSTDMTFFIAFFEALMEFLAGRWRASCDGWGRVCELMDKHSSDRGWEAKTVQAYHLATLFKVGEFVELSRRSPRLVESLRRRTDIYLGGVFAVHSGMMAALVNDDVKQARVGLARLKAAQAAQDSLKTHYIPVLAQLAICSYVGFDHMLCWQTLRELWPVWKRSGTLFTGFPRSDLFAARASVAAQILRSSPPTSAVRKKALSDATKFARILIREHLGGGAGHGSVVQAAVSAIKGDLPAAVSLLGRAESSFTAAGMAMYAAAAAYQRGRLLGGDEGDGICAEVEAGMRERGVARPDRMAAMLAPGFDEPESEPEPGRGLVSY